MEERRREGEKSEVKMDVAFACVCVLFTLFWKITRWMQ